MPQQTDYNNFTHPIPNSIDTVDADQWALILADFFEDEVDETIVKRGDLVDRPTSGSSNNVSDYPRMYLSLDQTPALLSVDSSTGWRDLNPLNLYAALDDNETVTGAWNYTQATDFDSTINVYGDQGHIDLFESDNSDKNWRFEAQNGDWQVTEVGVDTHLRIDSGQGGRVEHPNGAAFGGDVTFNGTGTFTQEFDGSVEQAGKIFGGGMVNGAHSDFATAQDAVDFADANGYGEVKFPRGTFGSINVPGAMMVSGTGASNSGTVFSASVSSGSVVTLGANSKLMDCAVSNTSGGSGDHGVTFSSGRGTIMDVLFHEAGGNGANTGDQNAIAIRGCVANDVNIGGNTIQITSNSSDCVVTANRDIGPVGNNGGGSNITAHNT